MAIDGVLRYELLAEEYYELTADPVKSTYHAEGTGELIAYFKVWLQQFFKHPLCYVEATWNQNYYLLAPQIQNQPRYAFPIIYTMPAVVAFYIQGIRSKRKKST